MKNIILIGMPGSGKSTAGVLLAKKLGMDFIDTDLIIQNETLTSLQDIINSQGVKSFLELENMIVSKVNVEHSVIATGGSVVYGEQAMQNLKRTGVCLYIKLSLSEIEKRLNNLESRGIAMEKNQTLQSLLDEREALYTEYADVTVDTDGMTLDQTVLKLSETLKQYL